MPNWVPQSPMWLARTTQWPRNSRARAATSPSTVERMWCTAISFGHVGGGVVHHHGLRRRQLHVGASEVTMVST